MGSGVRRVEAADEGEVVEIVRAARAAGERVRAAGSGGSKSGITHAPDVAMHLRAPDRLLSVEDGLVTAPAGMTTRRLQALLEPEGLALATVGEWQQATLAGALATATHGGSAHHGIMATSVRAFRLVTGEAEVVEVRVGDPDFRHAAVSLGAFGIATEVTLACVPRFRLELVSDVVSFDDYVRDPVAQESRAEFHASVWMPGGRRVIRFGAERIGGSAESVPRRERFGRRTALAALVSRRLGLHGAFFERLVRSRAVGDCADILSPLEVPSRVARFRNVANRIRHRNAAELAVDAARAPDILARFDEFFHRYPGPLNNPIGLRLNAADDFSLSPCSGRDTLWLDVFYEDVEPFTTRFAELAEEVGARCHWGKALALSPDALRASYPEWDTWTEARARFDPEEVFSNPWTDRLGLTGGDRPVRAP
ncbi:MAG: D-arabinono-1,4-lactone oxidase [Gemmatimonadota bacterium]